MSVAETVTSTWEPAFAVNQEGRMLSWNMAAERLLGHKASEVLNRRCWQVMAGRDVFGNDYCQKNCQLRRMALEGRPVYPFELVFRDAADEPVRARVSPLAIRPRSATDLALVHMLCPCAEAGDQEIVGWKLCQNNPVSLLTEREREVLDLVANGRATKAIAEELGLSAATARNHVQHILRKLRVHNRLEAAAVAQRRGLIC